MLEGFGDGWGNGDASVVILTKGDPSLSCGWGAHMLSTAGPGSDLGV